MRPLPRVLCVGPICLDELTFERDATRQLHPGGNGLIAASALAALGLPAHLLGVIGDDAAGHVLRDHLQEAGVDLSLLQATQATGTKIGKNIVRKDGTWYADPSHRIKVPYLPTHPDISSLGTFAHLHVGALNSLLRSSPNQIGRILEVSRQRRVSISIGLAGTSYKASEILGVLRTTDLVLCSEVEFRHLHSVRATGLQALIASLRESKFSFCVVTLGDRGAIAKRHEQLLHASAFGKSTMELSISSHLANLADDLAASRRQPCEARAECSVGAGDVFAGVFLGGYLLRLDLSSCLRAAAAAASQSVLDRRWDQWLDCIENGIEWLLESARVDAPLPAWTRAHPPRC